MSSNQGDLQASARAVSGTTSTFESDMLSMFSTQGVTSGAYNERLLQWINLQLGASFTSLPMAQNAFAASMGADTWNGLGTINTDYAPDGVGPACRADFRRQFFTLNGSVVPFSSIISLTSSPKWVIGPSGTLVQVAANTPAYDYSSGLPRLVLEGASTNIFLNSAVGATQSVTTTATSYTLSFYGTGSVTLSGPATGTLNGTAANTRVSLTATATAGTCTLTVTGSITNVQFEAQSFASSYIPTTSTAVTRTADSAQLTTAAAALLQASAASVALRGSVAATGPGVLMAMGEQGIIADTIPNGFSSGAFLSGFVTGTGSPVNGFGAVIALTSGNNAGAYNGGSVVSGTTNRTIASVRIGAFISGSWPSPPMYLDELVIWPARLTNTSLQNQARVWK